MPLAAYWKQIQILARERWCHTGPHLFTVIFDMQKLGHKNNQGHK